MKVALIYGGPSAEYEVSVNSAAAIRKNLDPQKYEVVDVHITQDEQWLIDDKPLTTEDALQDIANVDVAILAVHGTFGEDGKLQQLLSDHSIVFTGSDADASALAMDKVRAGEVFASVGLLVPATRVAETVEQAQALAKEFNLPFVVKPVHQGSSVGVSIVRDWTQLEDAIGLAFEKDHQIILQEFISGREVSCGVLADVDGEITALAPTELIPADADFFDYHAKYTPGATNEVTPPDMDTETIQRIQDLAVRAHQALSCRDYSRTDMFVRDHDIFLIETNTLPGMTETSILPQQAVVAGMTFAELIDRLINCAQARK